MVRRTGSVVIAMLVGLLEVGVARAEEVGPVGQPLGAPPGSGSNGQQGPATGEGRVEAAESAGTPSARAAMVVGGPIAGWFLMISAMPYLAVTSEAASRANLSTGGSAGTLGLGVHLFRILVAGVEIGLGEPYDDPGQFAQETTEGLLHSRVDAYYFSAFLGASTPPILFNGSSGWGLDPGLNLGYTVTFGASRHIEDCVDCAVQDLGLQGGLFVEPYLDFFYALPQSNGRIYELGVGLAYREYFLGDLQRAAVIRLFVAAL